MGILELGHINLFVRDLEKSRHFYRDILGLHEYIPRGRPVIRSAAYTGDLARTHHELFLVQVDPDAAPLPPEPRVGLYHFAFKVGTLPENLVEYYRKAKQSGVAVIGGSDHDYMHSLFLEDPDGNTVELYVDIDEQSWRDDPNAVFPPMPIDRPITIDGDTLPTQNLYSRKGKE